MRIVEGIINDLPFPPVFDKPLPVQKGQLVGYGRMLHRECGRNVADAHLRFAQGYKDLQPGTIPECLEEPGQVFKLVIFARQ